MPRPKTTPRPRSARVEWSSAGNVWDDADGGVALSFFVPSQPLAQRADDPEFDAECARIDEQLDARIIDAVRRKAIAGESAALSLCYRSLRGFARPVNVTPATATQGVLPPKVALAMIDAGLHAMGVAAEPFEDSAD